MNLWLTPQISEHCPIKSPAYLIKQQNWFNRPGTASIFNPKEGTDQEWITSLEETIKWIGVFTGKIKELSTSIKRIPLFKFNIYESKKMFFKSEYSYLQYHWWPIIDTFNPHKEHLSKKYNDLIEGKIIINKTKKGIKVQIYSNWWCSIKDKSKFINLNLKFFIINKTITITEIKNNIT